MGNVYSESGIRWRQDYRDGCSPFPGDIVPADPTDVRRSEFDALKREVGALRAAPTDAFGDLVTTFRAYAILKTQQSEEQRRAGHEVDGLVWAMAATCWTAAADELEALLKTTE